jgi:heat shock protein HtpX
MNNVKTVILLVLLSGILLVVGGATFGTPGLIVAGVVAFAMNIGSYWFSDKLALKMTGSKEVTPDQEPRLHRIVDEVASMARMPKPKVYVIQNDAPNAFATGRNAKHAAVAATTGIMRILDDKELTAVFGHELGHVRNRDILVSAVVATIASAIMLITFVARFSLIFGRRGYGQIITGADMAGAEITGTPLALASALEKLESYSQARPMKVNPAVSHLFIVNPLKASARRDGNDMTSGFFGGGLFSTHPPVQKRVQRLNEYARKKMLFS